MEELSKHSKKCVKCKEYFEYAPEQAWWDYSGTTDVKLVKCPECGCIQAVGYREPINPNYDRRFFD